MQLKLGFSVFVILYFIIRTAFLICLFCTIICLLRKSNLLLLYKNIYTSTVLGSVHFEEISVTYVLPAKHYHHDFTNHLCDHTASSYPCFRYFWYFDIDFDYDPDHDVFDFLMYSLTPIVIILLFNRFPKKAKNSFRLINLFDDCLMAVFLFVLPSYYSFRFYSKLSPLMKLYWRIMFGYGLAILIAYFSLFYVFRNIQL